MWRECPGDLGETKIALEDASTTVVLGFVNSAKPLITVREELHSRDTVKSCLYLGVQSHRVHHGLVRGSRSGDCVFGVDGCKGKQVKQDRERGGSKTKGV